MTASKVDICSLGALCRLWAAGIARKCVGGLRLGVWRGYVPGFSGPTVTSPPGGTETCLPQEVDNHAEGRNQ